MTSLPANDWKQRAVVTFRGHEYEVCIAPPGSEPNAISAAMKVAKKKGEGDIAELMGFHKNECFVEWGEQIPTRRINPKKQRPPKPKKAKTVKSSRLELKVPRPIKKRGVPRVDTASLALPV